MPNGISIGSAVFAEYINVKDRQTKTDTRTTPQTSGHIYAMSTMRPKGKYGTLLLETYGLYGTVRYSAVFKVTLRYVRMDNGHF